MFNSCYIRIFQPIYSTRTHMSERPCIYIIDYIMTIYILYCYTYLILLYINTDLCLSTTWEAQVDAYITIHFRARSSMLQGITRTEQAGLLPHHHHHHHHHHHQSLAAHHGIGTGSPWPPNHHDDLAHKGTYKKKKFINVNIKRKSRIQYFIFIHL